jgi:hypothetical protein
MQVARNTELVGKANFTVRHFAVGEVAELWGLSDDTVRKLFEREPGVLIIGRNESRGRKRRYRPPAIPIVRIVRNARLLSS